ncbi:hypothetical protein DPMN_165520 [Dreissena polymorpha]|uniref:Uncharacterized protein n=1 Tax=Dreissena polymorpha TaxID=45954 RepID=A0A9D4EX02_DREPO|nr:hypothetical protein DPMN_165520 [Dreissena polymorpha]
MGMRLQLSYFILFFPLVFCSSCPLDYLPGQIIGCFNHEPEANDQSVHDQIQTECAVRYQNISKVYVCINNQWVGKIGNLKADHKIAMLLPRHKRFLGDLWKFLFGSRSRDNSPPSLKCPEVQPLLAEPLQSYARVFWKEPAYALDDRDGWLIANQISGKSSGSYFTEDEWPVKYIAKDKVGNWATCVIPIYVKVVKCQTPSGIKNGYFRCNSGSVLLLGSNCEYGCYGGFDLIGKSQLTCTREGIWSAPTPACSPWQCPHLPNINGAGFPSCTDGQSYRSICEYTCEKPGYDMPPLVGKTLICSEDKTWHHVGTPICVDVEPPVFETCPSTLVYGTERSSNKSLVTWIEPTASDNSGEPVHVYLVRGHKTDTRLSAGQYDIIYGVRDQTGNTGNECGFSVIVRDIRCPMIYPTPYTRVSCPDGTRTGALCAISCEPGKKLLGIDSVSCEQTMDGLFGVWNWKNDTQSICENTLQCTPLEPPKSGAIACDNWLGGEFCQAQCQNGTEMPNVDLNGLYVCDDVGNWIPPPMFKACQAIHIPIQQSTVVNAAVTFDGDCSTLESQRQIAENFIYQLQHSIFFHPEVCPDNTDCNPDNVQISCGEVGRRKRSADSIPLNVNKTHVSVKIKLYLPTITDNIQDARLQYQTKLSNVQRFVSNDAERIFGNILVHAINIDGDGIKTHCDIGTVVSEDGLGCVACPAGTYINEIKLNENSECQLCQKGFYQDHPRQSYCKRFPEGKTTEHSGTQDSSQCKGICIFIRER